MIDPWLRSLLVCPFCRTELVDGVSPTGADELVCTNPACRRAYRVDNGIPALLVDEARIATE